MESDKWFWKRWSMTIVLAYVLAANFLCSSNPSAAKKLSCSTLCLIEIMTMRVNFAIEKIKIKFVTDKRKKKGGAFR